MSRDSQASTAGSCSLLGANQTRVTFPHSVSPLEIPSSMPSYSSRVDAPQGQSSSRISFTSPPTKISPAVRSGWVAAKTRESGAPSLTPRRTARSEPAASITARTSSIRSSRVAHHGAVREPHAALVEEDQPGEAGKPLHETAVARQLPVRLQVREPAHDEDQVDVALAQHLVGDVDVAGARVANFRECVLHAASIPPASGTQK